LAGSRDVNALRDAANVFCGEGVAFAGGVDRDGGTVGVGSASLWCGWCGGTLSFLAVRSKHAFVTNHTSSTVGNGEHVDTFSGSTADTSSTTRVVAPVHHAGSTQSEFSRAGAVFVAPESKVALLVIVANFASSKSSANTVGAALGVAFSCVLAGITNLFLSRLNLASRSSTFVGVAEKTVGVSTTLVVGVASSTNSLERLAETNLASLVSQAIGGKLANLEDGWSSRSGVVRAVGATDARAVATLFESSSIGSARRTASDGTLVGVVKASASFGKVATGRSVLNASLQVV